MAARGRFLVPGPGLEPGWIAPTVFETVASANSAIRAGYGRSLLSKISHFFAIFYPPTSI